MRFQPFQRSVQRVVVALPLVAAAACSTSISPDASGNDASSDRPAITQDAMDTDAAPLPDAAIDGSTGSDAALDATSSGPCPPTLPAAMTPCTRETLICQYGSDPREQCRPAATCSMGFWTVSNPTCDPITPPAMCPATREAASGQMCATRDAACAYDGLLCRCTNCRSFPVGGCNGPLLWQCNAPNPDMACPTVQPNLGTSCSPEGQRCTYDCEAYGSNGGRACQGGVWVSSPNNCPISSRRAKRSIEYLTDEQTAEITRDVLRTRLATYEYTDPALSGRRRLGFIYEDASTHRFARDPEISGVDLYGYTSLLLATVQTQQRQIEALQREVRALRDTRSPRR